VGYYSVIVCDGLGFLWSLRDLVVDLFGSFFEGGDVSV